MLTLKERRAIKKFIKKYNCEHSTSGVISSYKIFKPHDTEILKSNMNLVYQEKVKVNYEKAYHDLISSHKNMCTYVEDATANTKETININGKEVEHGHSWDFKHCYSDATCSFYLEAIEICNDIECEFDNYSKEEKLAVLAVCSALLGRAPLYDNMGSAWSIANKVEEIKAAEEKYGKKFFVNDWLYDTFMHPELFESYGVYKTVSEANYSLNKANIIQDRL